MRVWICCVAALALSAPVRAAEPVRASAALPTTDPLIDPAERIIPAGSLFDAATANDPLPLPSTAPSLPPRAIELCRCPCEFSTWFSAEWLVGTTRGAGLAPLITTGPASAGALAGAIGQPGTYPLFGGKQVLNDWRSGLRLEAGVWFDPDHIDGVSARFYSLFSAREQFAAMSNGTSVVDVPNFVPVGARQVPIPVFVGFPGVVTGAATASARTLITGGDLNYRHLLDAEDGCRIELLAGYRQLYLGDQLGAAFTAVSEGLSAPAPRLVGSDTLHTRNDFYGPQLGLCASTGWNRFTLEGHAATALGVTVSDLDYARLRSFNGGTTGTAPPLTGIPGAAVAPFAPNQIPLGASTTGGTLTYFGVVAEGGVRVNWIATDNFRLQSGYSFLYWNDVRRAPDLFTGSSVLRTRTVDSITHLLSAGVQMRY
jgi:hypothetical protein